MGKLQKGVSLGGPILPTERPKPSPDPVNYPKCVSVIFANHAVEGAFGWSRVEGKAKMALACTSRPNGSYLGRAWQSISEAPIRSQKLVVVSKR